MYSSFAETGKAGDEIKFEKDWDGVEVYTLEDVSRKTRYKMHVAPVCVLCINYSSTRLEIIFNSVFEISKIMSLVYQVHYFM